MINDVSVRTIKCDAPGCDKTATFAQSEAEQAVKDNPWIKTVRILQNIFSPNPQQAPKVFVYCSDVCEVQGVQSGLHNPVEKKIISMPTGDALAAVKAAAAAAEAARVGTQALREGRDVSIQPA
jgi:hypothetical protein